MPGRHVVRIFQDQNENSIRNFSRGKFLQFSTFAHVDNVHSERMNVYSKNNTVSTAVETSALFQGTIVYFLRCICCVLFMFMKIFEGLTFALI